MAIGKEVKTKIASIGSTQKITSAMEMVAASKMRRAQERMQLGLDKKAEIAETKALYEFANPRTGFAAGLSASVRPVITYLFFGLFLAVKAVILLKALEAGSDWKDAVPLMFDTETQALFSAIIAFWFGQRSVSKFMGANNGYSK